jgi:hypothetical protein
MTKEIILIIVVAASLILIAVTLPKINRLDVSKSRKTLLTYITILIPVLGYLLVRNLNKEA